MVNNEPGCEYIQLWVDKARVAARSLYAKCGIEEKEEVPDYYAKRENWDPYGSYTLRLYLISSCSTSLVWHCWFRGPLFRDTRESVCLPFSFELGHSTYPFSLIPFPGEDIR
jgi:hypothetical protein